MNNVISLAKYKQKNCLHKSLYFKTKPNKIIECVFCKKELSSYGAIKILIREFGLSKKEKSTMNDLLFDAIFEFFDKNNNWDNDE